MDKRETMLIRGGTIHTISNGDVDAVLVREGRVLATVTAADLVSRYGPPASTCELGGRTLVPGFVDAHNHYSHSALGRARSIQCWCEPIGDVASVHDLLQRLRDDRGVSEYMTTGGWRLLGTEVRAARQG